MARKETMILEHLYQKGTLPDNVNPAKVRQILVVLIEKLCVELTKKHVWIAVATRAVEAGWWRGERLKKRRLKLLKLINVCADALDMIPLEEHRPDFFSEGWESRGLHYGYGAIYGYAEKTGVSVEQILMAQYIEAVRDSVVAANRRVNPENN